MKYQECIKEQREALINLGFKWCGADGYICHLSHYKNKDGRIACNYCPRKKDWENNGVFEIPNEFKLQIKEQILRKE